MRDLLRAMTRDPDGPLRPDRNELKVFAGYVAAAGLYIGIGLAEVDFLLSFWTAMGYLLVVAWVVPLVVRKLR